MSNSKYNVVLPDYMSENPFAYCAVCGEPTTSKCSKCKVVHYCGREHQAIDHHLHKEICDCISGEMQKMQGKIFDSFLCDPTLDPRIKKMGEDFRTIKVILVNGKERELKIKRIHFTIYVIWGLLNGYFEHLNPTPTHSLYVDEEGRPKYLPVNHKATEINQSVQPTRSNVVGTAILTDRDMSLPGHIWSDDED